MYLGRERLMNSAISGLIAIAPESVVAMPFVFPSGMIYDRIKAYTFDIGTEGFSGRTFFGNVPEPRNSLVGFRARFGNEKREPILCRDLRK